MPSRKAVPRATFLSRVPSIIVNHQLARILILILCYFTSIQYSHSWAHIWKSIVNQPRENPRHGRPVPREAAVDLPHVWKPSIAIYVFKIYFYINMYRRKVSSSPATHFFFSLRRLLRRWLKGTEGVIISPRSTKKIKEKREENAGKWTLPFVVSPSEWRRLGRTNERVSCLRRCFFVKTAALIR